jgi:thiamine biosynthesis protein ThiS
MDITINGEKRQFDTSLTIEALLDVLGLAEQMVLVEQNLEVIPHDEMKNVQICEGDIIEILRLAGGG